MPRDAKLKAHTGLNRSRYPMIALYGVLAVLVLLSLPHAGWSASDAEILSAADAQRAPWPSFGLSVSVESDTARGVELREYRIAFKDNSKTLISYERPATSVGDLVLMNGDELWYYAKNTRRPIRITPLQRISGSVSYGDIARLSWSRDYTVTSAAETQRRGQNAILLKLEANTRGATYQRIDLWVTASGYTPISADVFLLSGKLFKTLEFTDYSTVSGRTMNTGLTIIDHLRNGESSKLQFFDIAQRSWSNRLFVKTGLSNVNPDELH